MASSLRSGDRFVNYRPETVFRKRLEQAMSVQFSGSISNVTFNLVPHQKVKKDGCG